MEILIHCPLLEHLPYLLLLNQQIEWLKHLSEANVLVGLDLDLMIDFHQHVLLLRQILQIITNYVLQLFFAFFFNLILLCCLSGCVSFWHISLFNYSAGHLCSLIRFLLLFFI